MPTPITLPTPPPQWRPSFPSTVDPSVATAINRLFDLVTQLQGQVQVLSAYLNKNP